MQINTSHKNYYPWFDWLRITLAFAVLLGHDGLLNGWSHAANFAVQVFFALSGWLIGGILLNISTVDLPKFYFNRALRIWVPYFFALALLVLASLLHDAITPKWLEFVFYKLSFVYNLFGPPQLAAYKLAMPLQGTGNHFWSVNAEEQFYLLAPLLLVMMPARIGKKIFTWVALALLAWFFGEYASIVFGVLAAILIKHFGNIHLTKIARIIFSLTIFLSIAGFIGGINYERIAPFCAISIVMLLATTGKQTALGTFVGGVSYPLYMNQWIGGFVTNAIFKHFGSHESGFKHLLTIVLSLLIASVFYWCIDKQILAARPKLYTLARGKLITVIAYGSVLIGLCVGLYLVN